MAHFEIALEVSCLNNSRLYVHDVSKSYQKKAYFPGRSSKYRRLPPMLSLIVSCLLLSEIESYYPVNKKTRSLSQRPFLDSGTFPSIMTPGLELRGGAGCVDINNKSSTCNLL